MPAPLPTPAALDPASVLVGVLVASTATFVLWWLRRRGSRPGNGGVSPSRLGPYTLERKIGDGGMGEVYLARHAQLARPAAVKALRMNVADEEAISYFEQEVQLTAQLRHPNTVAIYDHGRTRDGRFYYAMEYLAGASLERIIAKTGPFGESRTIHVLRQLCGSLSEAHGVRLIHRDIKPGNLMLCVRGGVYDWLKVLDFGLVKNVADDIEEDMPKHISGTPHYMAPEALSPAFRHDGRQDLYAIGAVAYFMLAGDHVFRGETDIEILRKHIKDAPEPLSERTGRDIEPTLERLVMQCLEKVPDARPPTAGAVLHALEACPDAGVWSPEAAQQWWIQNEPKLDIPEPLPHAEAASTFFA